MKTIRNIILTGLALAAFWGGSVVFAQTPTPQPPAKTPATTPPVVAAPHNGATGLPPEIKTLIGSFDATRDAYLASQAALEEELKNATTPAGRKAIREQLQANRAVFLAELKTFRTQLKEDIAALKLKIGREELIKIINAAYDAAADGGLHHHRGQGQ